MHRCFLAMLLTGFVVESPGYALDLTKIERRIKAEPKYESNTPKYCLLIFGAKASQKIWIVRDGSVLHVDRNANGVLGEPGETVPGRSSTSSTSFSVDNLLIGSKRRRLWFRFYSDGPRIRYYGETQHYVGFSRAQKPTLGHTPATAPIIHFDGPVTLARYSEKVTLTPNPSSKSYRKTSLRLMVGTRGLGPGTFAAMHCRCRKNRGDLVATFRYPTESSKAKLLVEQVTLKTYG